MIHAPLAHKGRRHKSGMSALVHQKNSSTRRRATTVKAHIYMCIYVCLLDIHRIMMHKHYQEHNTARHVMTDNYSLSFLHKSTQKRNAFTTNGLAFLAEKRAHMQYIHFLTQRKAFTTNDLPFLADKRAHLQYIHFLTLSGDALRPVSSARNGIHFCFRNAFAHHVGLGLSLSKKSLSSFELKLSPPGHLLSP